MRTFVFACRPFDEKKEFENCAADFDTEIITTTRPINMDTVSMAEGYDYVSVITNPVNAEILDTLKSMGVKMLGTRTVGYDHIDYNHAKKIGMRISNSAYSPDSVAEFTLALMLMSLRKVKRIMQRAEINDFTLNGLIGSNLSERKVGIVGTGCIGQRVFELLRGFGCEINAYDPCPDESLGVKYLPLEELFSCCDLISLHAPLRETTRHMVNERSISLMRPGTVIVNPSRGALIDTSALIAAMKSGHIAACGLDVIEEEFDLYYYDRKNDVLDKDALALLRSMPNAIVTPHIAFYSDRSVHDMVRNCILSFVHDNRGEDNPFRIV